MAISTITDKWYIPSFPNPIDWINLAGKLFEKSLIFFFRPIRKIEKSDEYQTCYRQLQIG